MVTPDEVEDAFVKANPGLSTSAIAVTCDTRRLSEVRICINKDLQFRACEEVDRRACRRDKVVMPPVRGRLSGVPAHSHSAAPLACLCDSGRA